LNVIIETQVVVPILVQQGLGNRGIKVFKLHQDVGPSVSNCLHEFIDHVIIFRSTGATLLLAQIKFVLQQFFIVGTNIQDHGQDAMGSNATSGTILQIMEETNRSVPNNNKIISDNGMFQSPISSLFFSSIKSTHQG
jgi:hypothetical protein